MKRDSMLATLRKFSGQENVLVVPKAFVNFTDSLEAAMMLSQLLYWSERNNGRSAIYKTDADWKDELSLTRYAVRQARTKLEEMGLIKTEIHRANGSPTVHYYLQEDAIERQWNVWIQTMESAKTDNRKSENGQSLTEITTETTSEIKEQGADAPTPSADEQFADLPSASETPAPVMSNAAREFFKQFNRKRWGTPAQKELFERTEADVGAARMMDAVLWAAHNNIPRVPSICTAARNGKQVRKNGGGDPFARDRDRGTRGSTMRDALAQIRSIGVRLASDGDG